MLRLKSGALPALAASIAHDPTFALGHAALALLGHELCADVDIAARLRDAGAARRPRPPSASAATCTPWSATSPATRGRWWPTWRRTPSTRCCSRPRCPTIAFAGVTEVPEEAWSIVERASPGVRRRLVVHRAAGLRAPGAGPLRRGDGALAAARWRSSPAPATPRTPGRTRTTRPATTWPGWPGWTRWVTGDGASIDSLSHFAWHAALHELSLGDLDAVRRRYDAQLRPEHGLGCRALVDTGSLLFRWALTPDATDVPGLDQVAALAGRDVLERPSTPFLAMHSAVTLLALDDRAGARPAGRAGPPATPTPPSARWSLPWPGPWRRLAAGRHSEAADDARRPGRPEPAARRLRRPARDPRGDPDRGAGPRRPAGRGARRCSTPGWTGGTRRATGSWRERVRRPSGQA